MAKAAEDLTGDTAIRANFSKSVIFSESGTDGNDTKDATFTPRIELILARRLRAALEGHSIGDELENSHELREFCTSLEFYLPHVLQEIHEEWKGEALDGIYPEVARKSAEFQIEIAGLCIFLNGQTLTPVHAKLEISPTCDQVIYLDCKLGQMGSEGMIWMPYEWRQMLAKPQPATNWDAIDWVYHVGFDQRKDSINER